MPKVLTKLSKCYNIGNDPITVRITSNAIEITSFPGFDRSISDKSIEEYKLTAEVNRMLAEKIIVKVMEGNKYFYYNVPVKQIFPRNFTKRKV